jgi:chromosome segregation ATPase
LLTITVIVVQEGINCGVVQWIDFEWPDSMEKALAKLWDMYEESKTTRTNDNLESSFTIHNLTEEKKKLQENYEKLVGDVNALLDAQEQRAVQLNYQQEQKDNADVNISELENEVGNLKAELSKKDEENSKLQQKYETVKNIAASQGNVIRNLKFNHLKEKERLTEERHKLQFHISELQKSEEKIKQKLQGVKVILDE